MKLRFLFNMSSCEVNPVGENSSIIFTFCVKTVSFYRVKPVQVVLHMTTKEFFETASKYGEIGLLIMRVILNQP